MATRKIMRQDHHVNNHAYVQGNTVRKMQPDRTPVRHVPDRHNQPKVSHTVRRNQDKALHMDLPYVCALTIAAICTLYLCVNYLQVQSSITSRIHVIGGLEKQLESLKSENDALETRINTSIDLDYIYKVATEELGMVYANKDQVILYNKTESEYVRQNEDIPKY